ncbi:MAG: MFS transporter, partial [Acidimicrobiales bacterium]
SEIFPMETRALAIAFFYAIGTAVGGISGPLLFGGLIASGSKSQVAVAFLIGAGVMALGGVAELFLGVKAEQAQLEDIAEPLTAADAGRAGDQAEPATGQRQRQSGESGLRRYRPGPGRYSSSPGIAVSFPSGRPALESEIGSIEAALRERGTTTRDELARMVGARYWGPGVFREALREAVAEGVVRRLSSLSYGLPAGASPAEQTPAAQQPPGGANSPSPSEGESTTPP